MHWPAVSSFVLAAMFASAAVGSAAILSALRVDPTPAGGARVVLSFAGPPPQYRVFGTGSTELTVQLAQTQTGPNMPAMLQGVGPIVSVRYAVAGASAQLVVRLAGPTPVRVSIDARDIFVDVAPLSATAPVLPLAAPPPVALTPEVVEVVPLKYADLSEIVGILVEGQTIAPNDTFAPQPSQLGQTSGSFGGSFGSFPTGQQQAPQASFVGGGQQQSVGQRINEHVAIDRRLNAVVLSGSLQQVAALRAMIEKIDVALPSVLLETQIVELTDTAAKAVGIDFTNGGGPIASVQYQSRSFNPPNATANLQAAIFDVVSHGGGKLIARPRVVAQNGTSASILTGDAIPIITNITSFGSATVTQQQVQYVSVGVNLQIQPRITLRRLRDLAHLFRGVERDGLRADVPADQPARRLDDGDRARRGVVRDRRAHPRVGTYGT